MMLDMRTVIISYVISNAICAGMMISLQRQNRERGMGLRFWVADFILQFLAILFIMLRGVIPDLLSYVAANTFVVAGTILLLMGLERYTGKKGPQIQNYLLLTAFVVVHAWFTFGEDNLLARSMNSTAGLMLVCLQIAWLMLHRVEKEKRSETSLVGGVMVAFSVVCATRLIVDPLIPQGNDFFQSGLYDILVILTFQMLYIVLTFALVLMVNRRLLGAARADLETIQEGKENLAISEEKFHLAFQNIPDILILTSLKDGRILEVNQAFFKRSGYTAEDIAGNSTITLNLWAEPEARRAFTEQLINEARVLNYESQFRTKSGEIFTGWISGEILSYRGEMFVLSIVHDVTEKIEAAKALQESEERYRTVADFTYEWEYWTDPSGRIKYISPSCERITGYTAEEFIVNPRLFEGIIVSEDLILYQHHQVPNPSAEDANAVHEVEFRIVRKDGEMRWIHHNCRRITSSDGTALGIRATNRDITESKLATEALKKREAELQGTYQSMTEMLAIHEIVYEPSGKAKDYRILNVNEAFEKATGIPREKAVGALASKLYGTGKAPYLEEYASVAKTGKPTEFETFFEPLGKTFHISVFSPERGTFATIALDITARKQMEETLQETNAYLQNLFDYANAPIIVWDTEFKITRFNHAFEKMTGYQAEEVLGKHLEMLFPEENRVRSLGMIEMTLTGERWDTVEIPILRKDGNTRIALWNSAYVTSADGKKIVASIAQGQDITERVQAEALIHARLDLLEFATTHALDEVLVETLDQVGALTASPIGFYHFVEADQKTLSLQAWSTRTSREYCKAEGKGMHYPIDQAGVWVECVAARKAVIHNDYASLPASRRKGLPKGHAPLIRELVVPILRGGKIVAILGVGNKSNDYTDKDVDIITFIADVAWTIAEHKRADEEIRKLSLFPLQNPHPILRVAEDGYILFANPASAPILAAWERNAGEVIPEDWQGYLEKVKKTGKPLLVEMQSGKRIFECMLAPIKNEDYVNIYARDISEQREAEDEVSAYAEHLEELVAMRTRELEEAQEKMLRQERLAVLGQLAGSVSHELRNPLGVIANAVYYLRIAQPDAPEKIKKHLEIIDKEMHIADDIIQDLLSFSRIKKAKKEIFTVDELFNDLQKRYPVPGNITLEIKVPKDIARLDADPGHMVEVLGNLVTNAWQAMPKGGTITLTARGNGAHVAVEVTDEGEGIAKDDLPKLFEPLYTTKINGFGLGLPICKTLLDANGGSIAVKSTLHKGSTFTILIPAEKESK